MLLRLTRTYLRPYGGAITAVVVLQLVGTIASLFLPSLNARIIDDGVVLGDTDTILTLGLFMLGVSLLQVVAAVGAVRYGSQAAAAFGRDVRAAVFRRVGTFSAREVTGIGAPSLITRGTNDVTQVQVLVQTTFTLLVAAPITAVGGVVMAVREEPGLAWLILVAVPLLAGLVGLVASRMIPQFRRMQVRIDQLNRVLREQITGIRVIRAFVREPEERARFTRANEDLAENALAVGRLGAVMFPLVMLVFNVSSVAVLWFGASRIDSGAMQIGALTAFLAYLIQILMSVMMATFVLVMVPRAAVCAERIVEVLDTASSVVPAASPVTELLAPGTVELRDVELRYPGASAPVLCDVDLVARAGQTTAVIGSTGSGKTTLLSLVSRQLDVTAGQVLVDGVDVRELDAELLGSRLGLVPQQPYLFSGTVRSNLAYGKPDATDEEMWQALEIAQAKDFVATLAEQLDAPVAQGGTNFSGGQRQRLAIARAVVRRPAVYLFDDSFSALDLGTDARLRAALRPVTRDAVVVVVAQRVSTIMTAEQIVVLEDGRVVGSGTHDELLASCPTYVEIVESQVRAEDAA